MLSAALTLGFFLCAFAAGWTLPDNAPVAGVLTLVAFACWLLADISLPSR